MMVAEKKRKKSAAKKGASDFFQKGYSIVTAIADKVMDVAGNRVDGFIHDTEKKITYKMMMAIPVIFFLLAISEFIGTLYPWYGRTGGYLAVAVMLFIVAQFYKQGMD